MTVRVDVCASTCESQQTSSGAIPHVLLHFFKFEIKFYYLFSGREHTCYRMCLDTRRQFVGFAFSLSTMCTLVEVSIAVIEHEDSTARKGFISVYNC